jgi:hypothetical protein
MRALPLEISLKPAVSADVETAGLSENQGLQTHTGQCGVDREFLRQGCEGQNKQLSAPCEARSGSI